MPLELCATDIDDDYDIDLVVVQGGNPYFTVLENTFGGSPSCCGMYNLGYTGNVNFDTGGEITLADVTTIIDYVFISKQPPWCLENANVNGDPGGDVTLSDITKLIDHIYISKGPTAACP